LDVNISNTAEFHAASGKNYTARAYCVGTTNNLYKLSKPVDMTAPDNGGKVVKFSLQYRQRVDYLKNNGLINKLLCLFSQHF